MKSHNSTRLKFFAFHMVGQALTQLSTSSVAFVSHHCKTETRQQFLSAWGGLRQQTVVLLH